MSLDHYRFYERNPQRRVRRDGTLEPIGAEMSKDESAAQVIESEISESDRANTGPATADFSFVPAADKTLIQDLSQKVRDIERALAKFESAKMPELKDFDAVVKQLECGGWHQTADGEIECADQAQAMGAEYLVKLRTFAAAEHVRAEEAEAKTVGKILRGLRSENDSTQLRAIIASIEASFPDAIRALQGKE